MGSEDVVRSLSGGFEKGMGVLDAFVGWGIGFINKYAMYLIIILGLSVFVKGFGIKLKVNR